MGFELRFELNMHLKEENAILDTKMTLVNKSGIGKSKIIVLFNMAGNAVSK